MSFKKFQVRAPGSLFLFGEHAVLWGHPSLLVAINAHLQVTWSDHTQKVCTWTAGDDHQLTFALDDWALFSFHPYWRHAVTVFRHFFQKLNPDLSPLQYPSFDVHFESNIPDDQGFGSSGALILSFLKALYVAYGVQRDPLTLLSEGLSIVRNIQNGRGSGGDLAASLWGGVVGYQLRNDKPHHLFQASELPGTLWSRFVGYKTPTDSILSQLAPNLVQYPDWHRQLFQLMGELTDLAHEALAQHDVLALGRHMNRAQGLLDALGVNDGALSKCIWEARETPGILGAKISGSGLGDCVIALSDDHDFPARNDFAFVRASVAPTGLEVIFDV